MYYSKLNKSSYYDFILSKDCKPFERDYDAYKLFFIDVTVDLCSTVGTTQDESVVLENISLTGYDNYFLTMGDGTIDPTVTYTVESGDTFCLFDVSGYTKNLKYEISNNALYSQLNGGFYQGFFKIFDYPVEFMPARMRKGWTTNLMLHFPIETVSGDTLNTAISGNTGFVFYLGTRAENKYADNTDLELDIIQNEYNITFQDLPKGYGDIDRPTGTTTFPLADLYYDDDESYILEDEPYEGYYNVVSGITYSGRTHTDPATRLYANPEHLYNDIIDNAFGIRITPEGRIGYRTIYATDPCYTGDTQDVSGITNNSFVDYTRECDAFTVGKIITKKFTIEESYTKVPVIKTNESQFLLISVVFERDFSYDTLCQLTYGDYKKGTLSIYINGFRVYRNKNVMEVIPHELDTRKEFQEGVPFTVSFGGGTQGLYEAIFLDPNKQVDGILEDFFGGTFDGGARFISMYSVPLYITEIRDIIKNELEEYNLYYPTGGRRIYVKTATGATYDDIYSIYATTVSIDTLTKQPFQSISHGSTMTLSLAAELGGYKQVFEIPYTYNLESIYYYNDITEKWDVEERLALNEFTISDVVKDTIRYKRYTYNKSDRGRILIKLTF